LCGSPLSTTTYQVRSSSPSSSTTTLFNAHLSRMSRTATAAGPSTSAPSDGSRTITITNVPTNEGGDDIIPEEDGPVGTLRVRAARTRTGPRVTWDEDVVDNEHAGKKKSKSTS